MDANELATAEQTLDKFIDAFRAAGELRSALSVLKQAVIAHEDIKTQTTRAAAELSTARDTLQSLQGNIRDKTAELERLAARVAAAKLAVEALRV